MLSMLIQNQPSVVNVSKLVLLFWPKSNLFNNIVLNFSVI